MNIYINQAIAEGVVQPYQFVLHQQGFWTNQANNSLYVKQTCEYFLVVIFYLENLIMLASNVTQLKRLKTELKK